MFSITGISHLCKDLWWRWNHCRSPRCRDSGHAAASSEESCCLPPSPLGHSGDPIHHISQLKPSPLRWHISHTVPSRSGRETLSLWCRKSSVPMPLGCFLLCTFVQGSYLHQQHTTFFNPGTLAKFTLLCCLRSPSVCLAETQKYPDFISDLQVFESFKLHWRHMVFWFFSFFFFRPHIQWIECIFQEVSMRKHRRATWELWDSLAKVDYS